METKKPKLVIIMGPTGSGKSKLAIHLASYFPLEVINADSMQVYKGLDVLTNKLPLHEQKGVQHHLLGTITPNVQFTSKDFRDSAIKIIDDIISRDKLPVIVGGTNYYIQALVSPFLLDDLVEEMDDCSLKDSVGNKGLEHKFVMGNEDANLDYERLRELDPDAANRIHPNDFRKLSPPLVPPLRATTISPHQHPGAYGRPSCKLQILNSRVLLQISDSEIGCCLGVFHAPNQGMNLKLGGVNFEAWWREF